MTSVDTNFVTDVLIKHNYNELTYLELSDELKFTEDEKKLLTIFWDPAFNGDWIYLSKELIMIDMGYARVTSFYKDTLKPNYIINVDYIETNKDDDLVKKYEEYQSMVIPIKVNTPSEEQNILSIEPDETKNNIKTDIYDYKENLIETKDTNQETYSITPLSNNKPHLRGRAKQYYKVTGKTLKKLLMKCGTK